MIRQFIHSFNSLYNTVRISSWRYSFFSFMSGLSYFWLFINSSVVNAEVVMLFLLFSATCFGFAALGYFINDFFDISLDAKAGKTNRISETTPFKKLILFSVILLITMIPWIGLAANLFSWILIGIQILLFLLYSLPHLRFKENWLLSAITDACYAYVIPTLLSYNTYLLFFENKFSYTILWLTGSMFFAGFRNILIHQTNDLMNDKKVGVITFPQRAGLKKTVVTVWICLTVEVCFYIIFLLKLATQHHFLYPLIFLYFISVLINYYKYFSKKNKSGTIIQHHFSDHYYQIWIPLLFLLLLLTIDFKWCVFLVLHMLVLVPKHAYNSLISFYRKCVSGLKNIFIKIKFIAAFLVNNSIYYTLRIVGVDLKKKKKSLLEYLTILFFAER